ncbi:3-hydroxyisobutyrate dehydrogenase-like beta-hydroxyacid dehydrogenase [Silvibacterium bohemicum]|uniref:3-hydroxyisobutyrate dehydrogenase-like beta-hydroxyacid dehydrogenase n=1 Tax=Silvibacterium bohemicum TaxID=1577686 RepID=A0A841JM49_9BACT|nr:NAD(P)-dependent oxidoreductase [Silvibacterium bohemicum]MBB6142303.1 3-hydroxyisobutyrate dehydrogenase-like beta-hydroxyacid dehydrogenase [Silvibacterium bohemicum]
MRIAFLGLGKMGSAIARHLIGAGHELTVWNRSLDKTQTLKSAGANVGGTPSEAVAGAEIVFTMLMDDTSLVHVVYESGLLAAIAPGAIHVSLSTISVALSDRLTADHRARGQDFVAAPVFGRPNVAEDGKLWVVAAGADASIQPVRPLLQSFSRGVTVVSEKPSSAHALKLGGNFLITAMIASLSETLVYAEANGIEPALFLETINSALFQSPFYQAYSKIILNPPQPPGGTIGLGEKDMRLFREAAHNAGVKTPLGDAFAAHLENAIEAGMRDEDWAAGYYRLAKAKTLEQQ